MLQVKYPSLLNANNFISLPQYESRFYETERKTPVTPDNLVLLVQNLLGEELKEAPSELFARNSYKNRLEIYLAIASYCKLIILSPNLSNFSISLQDVFQIWELRINLLLMATSLRVPGSSSQIPPIPNAQFLRNETNLFLKELIKLDDKETLPKELSWHFKLLINRIKYGPSLILVNQLYNELLQLRATTPRTTKDLANKSSIILYNVCAIMIARNELLTVFNLLNQTLESDSDNPQQAILAALVGCLYTFKEKGSVSDSAPFFKEIVAAFEKTDSRTLSLLVTILNSVKPVYNEDHSTTMAMEKEHKFTLQEIISLVEDGKISGRILCSLCGLFEVERLTKNGESELDKCLDLVHQQWTSHVQNIYAFE
ncbi:hypothetical protein KL911_001236 [Ogataea haglerorum]|uniref:uncharacterized protein n=1 Tax=Ogataea haglerorum TaxID=1937702 RepID=UPI001C89BBCD|nr:uncharacterized protein KL911_001236 [Ogataea haglerorum]KAG7751264.1 hypothetical protein KL912_000397 [Ogataea haglerorum]KAG7756434.1 hypothetical protein KL911_001236 [Ogataea haglerorum]KAG7783897.1 hypothetical protein KL945_004834 [Ogataea haglerorum]KAG7793757.1 hypothetical protein KL910_000452 [Ogataea haglerorum]KAG7804159.1 hypothetical protein KL944_001028 [Ogataea haglerorum]